MDSYVRLTTAVSRVSWVVVVLVTLVGAYVALGAWNEWRDARALQQTLEGAAAESLVTASESASAVVSAQDALSAAEDAESAAESYAMLEIQQKALEFDSRVEEMAQAGLIPRNPWSGLGMPPAGLLEEMNADTPEADKWALAIQTTKDARLALEVAEEAARDSSASALVASDLSNAAELKVLDAKANLQNIVSIGVIALGAVVVVAVAFTVVASRAKAQRNVLVETASRAESGV